MRLVRPVALWTALPIALAGLAGAPVHAQDFEIITPGILQLDNTGPETGISSAGGLVWIVAGSDPISLAQLQAAHVSVSVGNPALSVSAGFVGAAAATPVLPGEVVGTTQADATLDNSAMTGLIEPGETLKALPLVELSISHPAGHAGSTSLTGRIRIGTQWRHFEIDLLFGQGPWSAYTHANDAQRVEDGAYRVLKVPPVNNRIDVAGFDAVHGTLVAVQLDVTASGSSSVGGSHLHNHAQSFLAELTSSDGLHAHSLTGLVGSANGVTVDFGSMAHNSASAHAHEVFFLGTQTSTNGGHLHDYGPLGHSQSFGPGELAPFLGSDFMINATPPLFSDIGHAHCFGVGCGVPTDFRNHTHVTNPLLTALTTFTFDPAPPAVPAAPPWAVAVLLALLLGSASAGLGLGRIRRG